MHPIHYECPHCHEIIAGDDSQHGQRVKCPKCQVMILVPPVPVSAEPQTARLMPAPAARLPGVPGATDQETEIFHLTPVARAFSGLILLAFCFLGLALGLVIYAKDFTWSTPAEWILLALGVVLIVTVGIRVKSSSYRLTTQRLFVRRGWLAKRVEEMELYRVKDVMVDQGILQRLLGYGTISVLADDDTTPQMELVSIARPNEIKELIRTHYRAARQREGVRPTEFMHSP